MPLMMYEIEILDIMNKYSRYHFLGVSTAK
jgi:hypothetical protein